MHRRIRPLSRHVVKTVLPLSLFQIVGHIFSSISYSYIAVSFAHTIKALAPLFTVLIYRIFYSVIYSMRIYYSLAPLTIGVMLVSISKSVVFHPIGFGCAMMSTLIFVLQNIFSKKLFQNARRAAMSSTHSGSTSSLALMPASSGSSGAGDSSLANNQTSGGNSYLDKLNLLFYSSIVAFFLMFPIWLYSEGISLLSDPTALPSSQIQAMFVINGVGYFIQALLAFTVLSLVSPVTYSIASLVKRIFIISASMIWFGDAVTLLQGFGIALTFSGLYIYDRARWDVARSEARLIGDEEVSINLPLHANRSKRDLHNRSGSNHQLHQLHLQKQQQQQQRQKTTATENSS
ncbi:MAG: hypothetical protein SGCHY_001506 [Lobulomycetales sp.]